MYELFVFLSLNSNFHAKSSNFTTQTKVSPTAALNVPQFRYMVFIFFMIVASPCSQAARYQSGQ